MKIIDKYKDFYDFMNPTYDDSLVYVRTPKTITTNYNKYYDKYHLFSSYYRSTRKYGVISLENVIFGIFPYIYSVPIVNIEYIDLNLSSNVIYIILSKNIVDKVLETNDPNILIDYCYNNLDERTKEAMVYNNIKIRTDSKDIRNWLAKKVWKIECNEIFYKMEAPIFVENKDLLLYNTPYYHKLDLWRLGANKIYYVTNVCFNKLDCNILKYWYDELNDINTYINIENFLYSVHQEPIANPDNKTKILAHGFDLKTSFRNMN